MIAVKVQFLGIILITLLCNNLRCCWENRSRPKRCECGVVSNIPKYRSKTFHSPLENHRRRKVRIVGGDKVIPANKYPWMVSILKDGEHHCGGVILSEHYVLTAAHCVVKSACFEPTTEWDDCYVKPERLLISYVCMKPKCPVHNSVVSVQSHRRFRPHTIAYDIALLKVKKKIPCNDLTTPICLSTSRNFERSGTIGIIAGWGQTESGADHYRMTNMLHEGKMIIQDHNACGKFSEVKTHFCAFNLGQAICRGDSGGPFFVEKYGRSYIVGISSFGSTPDCTHTSKEFFTKVRLLVPWIIQKMLKG